MYKNINLITGYDIHRDECGDVKSKYCPSIGTMDVNTQAVKELEMKRNNKLFKY